MKEILFAGKTSKAFSTKEKNTKVGDWVYGLPFYGENGIIDGIEDKNGNLYFVCPKTIRQFVGLTAKNDKKIFVGDVLKNQWGDVFLVVDEENRFVMRTTKNRVHTWKYVYKYELIGNIIDNLENFKIGDKK